MIAKDYKFYLEMDTKYFVSIAKLEIFDIWHVLYCDFKYNYYLFVSLLDYHQMCWNGIQLLST